MIFPAPRTEGETKPSWYWNIGTRKSGKRISHELFGNQHTYTLINSHTDTHQMVFIETLQTTGTKHMQSHAYATPTHFHTNRGRKTFKYALIDSVWGPGTLRHYYKAETFADPWWFNQKVLDWQISRLPPPRTEHNSTDLNVAWNLSRHIFFSFLKRDMLAFTYSYLHIHLRIYTQHLLGLQQDRNHQGGRLRSHSLSPKQSQVTYSPPSSVCFQFGT